jgi:hypothetical protein
MFITELRFHGRTAADPVGATASGHRRALPLWKRMMKAIFQFG